MNMNVMPSCLTLLPPVAPSIQHGPQVFGTVEGTGLALPCRASGLPPPDITWAKVSPPAFIHLLCVWGPEVLRPVTRFLTEKLWRS